MSALPMVAPKIEKLIPMLSSPNDGEVVNTARAIERTLKGAGLDWHDFARAFTALSAKRPEPQPESDPRSRTYHSPEPSRWPKWRNLDPGEKVMAFDGLKASKRLSPWERSFVHSLDGHLRVRPYASLTSRQTEILDQLLAKIADEF